MTHRTFRILVAAAVSTLPVLALAHTGIDAGAHHESGFIEGLLHPLTGVDHLAAMLAVGLWSALAARRIWVAPLSFAAMLLAGALLGMAGVQLPGVEPMIAVSLLVFGLLVATRAHAPAAVAAMLVGLFAVFHGVAHGSELTGGATAWAALAGMLLCTLMLHIAGLGLGLAARTRSPWWPRIAGASISALGGGLLLLRVAA